MLVAETTLNELAAVPPKLTAVAPVKFVPVKVTVAPVAALIGVKEVMTGAGMNVNPARTPVPPGVVTLIFPEVPVATTAVMLVAETTLKEVAAVPPKLRAVAPIKLVPVRVTVAPVAALVGVKEVMTGAGMNVKPARTTVPPGVVTLTFPLVPAATTAVMLVAETTLKEVAAVPPKLTAVVPVKLVPVNVTVLPVAALVGVNEVIIGAGMNINPASVPVPPGVVTLTFPEVPAATTAVMLVAETTLKEVAAVPPKLTAVAPVKSVPVKVTVVVEPALVGVNEVIVGAGMNVNPAKIPVPPGVVTLTFPLVPAATTAVMLVAETTLKEVAAVPPKLTAVVPVKSVPVKVTVVVEPALVGVNEVITGAGINVNPARVPVPPGAVTLTSPEVPAAITAVMLVAETTLKEVAAVPPKLTTVAPVKLVPVKVIVAPVAVLVGVKEVIVGGGT